MADKEHICTRMIRHIEAQGLRVTNWEEKQRECGVKISVGYLARAAKDGTSIGMWLVDNFLSSFPDVEVDWLVTGNGNRLKSEKKHTDATNSDEAAVTEEKRLIKTLEHAVAVLDRDNEKLWALVERLTGAPAIPDKSQ